MKINRICYHLAKNYIRIGFAFYFKKIHVHGKNNIPNKKAIIFAANHQNALIDPLLIGCPSKRKIHFLTQAQVFKNPKVDSILRYVNMLPVYRMRDGYDSISKNDETFEKCYQILDNKETIVIFPEGSHSLKRRIRPLSKGFTRITFGALERNPKNEIEIIPVGYNYSDAKKFGSEVSVYYGKPISVNYFWENYDKIESVNLLKKEVSYQLKKLTTHIEDTNNYDQIIKHFSASDFLHPEKVNEKLKNLDLSAPIPKRKKGKLNLLSILVKLNSVIPLLIWKKASRNIKEEEYITTFRFSVGLVTFPINYLIQMGILIYFTSVSIGLIYFCLSLLSVYILAKTMK